MPPLKWVKNRCKVHHGWRGDILGFYLTRRLDQLKIQYNQSTMAEEISGFYVTKLAKNALQGVLFEIQ